MDILHSSKELQIRVKIIICKIEMPESIYNKVNYGSGSIETQRMNIDWYPFYLDFDGSEPINLELVSDSIPLY